jgi:methyl-accepting chemotaxis protein
MMIMVAMGLRSMSHIKVDLDKIVEENVYKMDLLQTMSESVHIASRMARTAILLEDINQIESELKKVEAPRERYDAAREALEKMPASEKGMAIRARIREARETARTLESKIIELAKGNQDAESITLILTQARPATQKWQDALHENIELQKEANKIIEDDAHQAYDVAVNTMLILAGIAVLIGIAAAFVITRSLRRQLGGEPGYAAQIAERIAQGDLTVAIDTKTNDHASLLFAMKSMCDNR